MKIFFLILFFSFSNEFDFQIEKVLVDQNNFIVLELRNVSEAFFSSEQYEQSRNLPFLTIYINNMKRAVIVVKFLPRELFFTSRRVTFKTNFQASPGLNFKFILNEDRLFPEKSYNNNSTLYKSSDQSENF